MGRRASINAKKRNRRIITISIVVAIIASVVVLTLVIQSAGKGSDLIGKPVDPAILQAMTGVSDSTLAAVGKPTGVFLPNAISGTALTSGGKPEVVYIGGDYCPYCAVERWSLIIALSHFGNFSGLQYMQSSSTDVNPNSPTFTFRGATYTSNYLSFLAVEQFDRSGTIVQPLTSDQQSLITSYDTCPSTGTNGGIPFIDIANAYATNCGAQSTLSISGQNWTQVASTLNTASNPTAQHIDGAANTLISAFCKVILANGHTPPNLCTQSYATLPLSYTGSGAASGQQTSILIAPIREESRRTGSPSRL